MARVPTHIQFACGRNDCDWRTKALVIRDVANMEIPPDAQHADETGHSPTIAYRGDLRTQTHGTVNHWR